MPQTQRRIEQLMEQMPYLRKIRFWATHVSEDIAALEQVSIVVMRADPNFMFRIPMTDKGRGSYIRNQEHPDWVGVVDEFFYPVNQDGEPGQRRDGGHGPGLYVRDIFSRPIRDWEGDGDSINGQDPFDVVKCLVWVRSIIWTVEENETDSVDAQADKPVHVDIKITVYREALKGWAMLYADSDPLENVVLSGANLWPNSVLVDGYHELVADRLGRLALKFEHLVVRKGLWPIIDRSTKKGMSGQIGDIRVLTYVIMGRLVIKLERKGNSITFRGIEHEKPNLGFSSIYGTLPSVTSIVTDACGWWSQMTEEERSRVLVDDPNVNMGI